MNAKQKKLRAALDEITEENNSVAQRRGDRNEAHITKLVFPEGKGPFYGNRSMLRSMMRQMRVSRDRPLPTMHMVKRNPK